MAELWLRNGKFPDWIAEDVFWWRLCQIYTCLPSQLDEEDWHVISRHRSIAQAERRYIEADATR